MKREARPYLHMKSTSSPVFIGAGKSVFRPGESHVRRVFTTFVAMFVTEGTVYLTEDGREYELEKGQWFIQTPGLLHFGHRASTETAAFYWVHFLPSGGWEMTHEEMDTAGTYRLLQSGEGVRLPVYILSVAMHFPYFPIEKWRLELEELTSIRIDQNFIEAQSRWLHLLSAMQNMDIAGRVPAGHLLAQRIYDYIQEHFHRNITVESLSEQFHFSSDYLSRCFRMKYGLSPAGCMLQLRMEHAKKQIISSNRSVREIAEEAGYQDLSVFSRAFKNYQGLSPAAYRRSVIGSP